MNILFFGDRGTGRDKNKMKAKISNGGLFLICKAFPVSEMFREPIAANWLSLPAAAGCMLMLFLPGEAQAEAVTGSRHLLWSVPGRQSVPHQSAWHGAC